MPFCFPYLILTSSVVMFFWTSSITSLSALVHLLPWNKDIIPFFQSVYSDLNDWDLSFVLEAWLWGFLGGVSAKYSDFSVPFVSRFSVTNFKDSLGWQPLWSVKSACRSSSKPFTVRMLLGQTGPNLNQTSRSWEKAAHAQWSCYTVLGFDNWWISCSLWTVVEPTLALNKSEGVLNSMIE